MASPEDKTNDLSSLVSLPTLETHPEPAPSEIDVGTEMKIELPEEEPTTPVDGKFLDKAPSLEPKSGDQVLDELKNFSENLSPSTLPVEAAFPFTLRITGKLLPEEVEKLLTILSRENMGIREVDLEYQITEGKILLPRISEYAGVLLVQALRGISAQIDFRPSDETPREAMSSSELGASPAFSDELPSSELSAEELPMTQTDALPQLLNFETLDVLTESALLSTQATEASQSEDYLELIEALKRKLKVRAKRLGAQGLISVQISLTPLTLPTDYRVTLSATAVRGLPE